MHYSTNFQRPRSLAVMSLAVLALSAPPVSAADGTWDGGGAQALNQGIWGGVNNWNPNGAIADGIGFTANFGTAFTNGPTCIVNTNRTIGNITYNDPADANNFILGRHASDFILTLNVNSGAPQINVTQAGRTLTIAPRIGGDEGLTKIGPGTLVLTNASLLYTGPTTVNDGTLLINAPGILNVGSDVTVNAGTLGGSGTIGGNVKVEAAGHLAPGASAGTLSISGNLDLTAQAAGTGKLVFVLDALAATSDQIAVGGAVGIGSALGMGNFVFTNLAGLETGTYKLITSSGLIGALDSADLSGAIGAFTGTLLINGNDLELVVSTGGATPYATWSDGAAFNADANGDRVDNGLAWMLGAATTAASGLAVLPVVATETGFLTLTFKCPAARGPAKLYLDYGPTLTSWTPVEIPAASATIAGGSIVVVTPGSPNNDVTVKVPHSLAAPGGRLFVRLRTTEN